MFDESPQATGEISPEISQASEIGIIEIAQAPSQGGETIGQISAVQGSASITRTDGSKVPAADGTAIFQGDLVETQTGGAVGITFADESTFSLAENGSMVIDEMVYDPGSQSGKSTVNIAQGIFTFISGQIAKTDVDAMLIKTPVAVIGIRGTAGGGQAGPEGTPNTYSMFQDPTTGEVGQMVLRTNGGSTTFTSANQTSVITSSFVPPTIPVTLPGATMSQFYAKAAATGQKSFIGAPSTPASEAAGKAFTQAILEGRSPAEAIATASDAGRKTAVEAVLADNPEAYGTEKSADSISQGQKDDILDKVAGRGDPLDPGTGKGPNYDLGQKRQLEDPIDGLIDDDTVIEDSIEGAEEDGEDGPDDGLEFDFFEDIFFEGDFFEDIFFFDDFFDDFLFGDGDDDFFEAAILFGLDDPFSFQDEFFFDEAFFFGGDFDDEFFFEDDEVFFFDPVFFDDEFDLTSADDILLGGAGNTEYIIDQGIFGLSVYGGNDIIDDQGGTRDRITFEGVDNVVISMTENSGNTSRVLINIGLNTGAFNITSTGVTSLLTAGLNPVNTIDITKDVEDLQALDSDFTNFDSGGVLLFGALDVRGSETGYIVAGSDNENDIINLSGFSNSATTLGSIIFGKDGDDTLTGTAFEDDLVGGAGNDTLDGNDGFNFVDGGSGDDLLKVTVASSVNDLDGGIGIDTVDYSSLSNDTTYNFGTFGSLALSRSGGGADIVFSVEILKSGGGADVFNFNTISLGFTTIDGGGGDDAFFFNTAGAIIAATIDGGIGTDTITLFATTDLFVQNVETVTGSSGNDTIDFVGTTATTITGGGGADAIALGSDSAADIVRYTSFNDGATDLTAANADSITQFAAANDSFNFVNASLSLNGTTTASVASGTANFTGGTNGAFFINNVVVSAGNLTDFSTVSAAIGNLTGNSVGDKAIFALNTSSTSGIYAFTDGNGDATVDASEIQLLAIADSAIDNTDLVIV